MEDPFIVSTTLAGIKPSGDSRRLIRRHVMKGKNTKSIKTLSRQKTVDPLLNTVCRMHTPVTTMDLATMGFPVDLEPYMIELITKFFVIVEETGSPLFRCTEKGSPTSPYDMIYNDLAHLHIILFMAQTYFDSKLRKHTQHSQHTITSEQALFPAHQHQPSRRALLHMNKAIEHLQRKLAVPDLSTSLSAVFVVLCLGTCAENTGNLELAEKHLRGMHQIIESRGGIHSLDSYPLVRLKCCRFDIDLSLKTGRRPLLVSNVSWKAYLADSCSLLGHKPDFSYYGHSESRSTPLHTSPDTRVPPDARLANVWNDLATICRSFNLALQLGRKVDILLSNEVLVSIMYRLQNLEGAYQTPGSSTHDPGDWKREVSTSSPASLFPASAAAHEIPQAARAGEHGDDAEDLHGEQDRRQLHELVRVTMLAFMTTIFFEPHGLDSEYVLLSRQLLTAISAAFQRLEEAEEARSPCEKCGHSNNNNNNNNNSSVTPSTETLKLYLWILYAARISLFTGTTAARHPGFSAWLHDKQVELRRVLGLETWAKTRAVLKSFPWVDAVHDAPGKVFYDARGSEATGGGGEGEGVILPAYAGMSGLYRGDVAICTGRGV